MESLRNVLYYLYRAAENSDRMGNLAAIIPVRQIPLDETTVLIIEFEYGQDGYFCFPRRTELCILTVAAIGWDRGPISSRDRYIIKRAKFTLAELQNGKHLQLLK